MTHIISLDVLRETILQSFTKYDSIGLVTHINPDGDGLCCCLALQELIDELNSKTAEIILEDEPLKSLAFLSVNERTIQFDDNLSYSLLIILDCQSPERVGKCAPLIEKAEQVIIVDHHEPSPLETKIGSLKTDCYIYNDPSYASVGAILFETLQNEIRALSGSALDYVCKNLYVTIINDTNNFTNSNTDSKTFTISSELVELGVDPYQMVKSFYASRTPSYYRFVGQTLSTIKTYFDDSVLLFHSTINMLKENNLDSDATDKMTNNIKDLSAKTKVIVYLREVDKEHYRLSLRSYEVNVNRIATVFGGGGHITASGCEMTGSLEHIEQQILELIKEQL